MGAAYFYHLTERTLADTLRSLTQKSLANGWRVAIRGRDTAGLQSLDEALWLGPQDGFLPHGMAGGDHDADQPALLTCDATLSNSAVCVMAVQGADVSPAEVAELERVCILFDGHDEDAVAAARRQWKTLTDAGAAAQYWSEASGAWEMKASSG